MVVLALILSPLVHMGLVYSLSSLGVGYGEGFRGGGGGDGIPTLTVTSAGERPGDDRSALRADAWAGSSQVMLAKASSLGENVILIPDADWIELQISRRRAAVALRPPQRLPLPRGLDPPRDGTRTTESDGVVLYSLTAHNGRNLPADAELEPHHGDALAMQSQLWESIQLLTKPTPLDAWPCWSHNSLAQFREDGYAVLFPLGERKRARLQVATLAREFGQSAVYEFVTVDGRSGGDDGGGLRGAAEGERLVGRDGSALVAPVLPDGRSDAMVRRTLPVATPYQEWDEVLPTVVFRRVRDLPVEDELTMREWEGPPLEQVVWKKGVSGTATEDGRQ